MPRETKKTKQTPPPVTLPAGNNVDTQKSAEQRKAQNAIKWKEEKRS